MHISTVVYISIVMCQLSSVMYSMVMYTCTVTCSTSIVHIANSVVMHIKTVVYISIVMYRLSSVMYSNVLYTKVHQYSHVQLLQKHTV